MLRLADLSTISVANLTIGRIDPALFRAQRIDLLGRLCDAGAISPPVAALPTEARTDRLHPGDGVLPLAEFVAMLPEGTPLAIETPVAAEASWTTQDRLNEAARRTLTFMQISGSPAP